MAKDDIRIASLSSPKLDADFWKVREYNKQKRINLYHKIVHILAFLIIIPYLTLTILGAEISQTYSTIVSIVVGFYFARSLLED